MNTSAFRILTALSVPFMASCAGTSPVGMNLAPGGGGAYNGHTRIPVPAATHQETQPLLDQVVRKAKPRAASRINQKMVENGHAPIPGLFPQNTGGSSLNGGRIIDSSAIADRVLNEIFD